MESHSVCQHLLFVSDEPIQPLSAIDKSMLAPKQLEVDILHREHGLQGKGVEIAILDTGILHSHEVFSSKKGKNPIDGCNFIGGDPPESWHTKPGLHGTAVAAIAAGNEYVSRRTQNEAGEIEQYIAGIAPRAKLYICRISDGKTYPWTPMANALQHLIDLKTKDPTRIDIVVMSFGGKSKDQEVEKKLKDLADLKVILLAAGGNDGDRPDNAHFPASNRNVIAVGAFGTGGHKTDFTTPHACVYAPGKAIYVPSLATNSEICTQDGTSFAAPVVAGFLALLLQCAKESDPDGSTKKVMDMYHNIDFLNDIFHDHELVSKDPGNHHRLFYAQAYLVRLREHPDNIIKLIQKLHSKEFTP